MALEPKLDEIFGYVKQILESQRPITGIWYYVYMEPDWKLVIFKSDEYNNISHYEAWMHYVVPKLVQFYGLESDEKNRLEDAYRGFPRGRVDLNTSPDIIDPSNKFMVFHGNDFPSSLNSKTEEGKILGGFNLAGLMARGVVELKFAEHETMVPEHVKTVVSVIGEVPY